MKIAQQCSSVDKNWNISLIGIFTDAISCLQLYSLSSVVQCDSISESWSHRTMILFNEFVKLKLPKYYHNIITCRYYVQRRIILYYKQLYNCQNTTIISIILNFIYIYVMAKSVGLSLSSIAVRYLGSGIIG